MTFLPQLPCITCIGDTVTTRILTRRQHLRQSCISRLYMCKWRNSRSQDEVRASPGLQPQWVCRMLEAGCLAPHCPAGRRHQFCPCTGAASRQLSDARFLLQDAKVHCLQQHGESLTCANLQSSAGKHELLSGCTSKLPGRARLCLCFGGVTFQVLQVMVIQRLIPAVACFADIWCTWKASPGRPPTSGSWRALWWSWRWQ